LIPRNGIRLPCRYRRVNAHLPRISHQGTICTPYNFPSPVDDPFFELVCPVAPRDALMML